MFTLTMIVLTFSLTCSLAWGSGTQPIVTENLPVSNPGVVFMKALFTINLICSYPLTILPSNTILEGWIFGCMKQRSTLRTWLKNLNRLLVCIFIAYFAVELASKIDKFLSLVGALLCAPLALTMPSLIHLNTLARTNS